MPVTRSTARAASNSQRETITPAGKPSKVETAKSNGKRKAPSDASVIIQKKARAAAVAGLEDRSSKKAASEATEKFVVPASGDAPTFVPAVLSFSFEDAKRHLIGVDPRFEDIFNRMKCRPFEHLERLDPFRTLTTSILGQQISWMAARSIIHKFIRLYDPSLPEKPQESKSTSPDSFFPTAHQVVQTDIPTLRSAGLSGRKAEYVLDLAARFADGRLTTQKLLDADDEELADLLIQVRGIGRWTVDMFAIFSLRRPDVLPVGDLGVQRGMLRWFLSLHSPSYKVTISPEKLPKLPDDKPEEKDDDNDVIGSTDTAASGSDIPLPPSPDVSSVPPAPVLPSTPKKKGRNGDQSEPSTPSSGFGLPSLPPLFTPSINRTLNADISQKGKAKPEPLPEGLTVSALKSRLDGKKKIKGALLTPQEMEELTLCWKPYRSVGVYYMWSLAEEGSK